MLEHLSCLLVESSKIILVLIMNTILVLAIITQIQHTSTHLDFKSSHEQTLSMQVSKASSGKASNVYYTNKESKVPAIIYTYIDYIHTYIHAYLHT